jgi:hypothetical protein
MGLTVELSAKLDCSSLGTTLIGTLSGHFDDLQTVEAPVPGDQLADIASGTAGIDISSLSSAVTDIAQQALPIIAGLPDANAVFGTLNDAIALIEEATQQDLSAGVATILDRLKQEMAAPPEGGRFALIHRLIEVLSGSAEGQGLQGVLGALGRGAEVQIPALGSILDVVGALDGLVSLLGGLMCLESVLAEAERLSQTMATNIDPGGLQAQIDALNQVIGSGPVGLAQFVTDVAGNDPAAVASALSAIRSVAALLEGLPERLSAAMGMGEATLVYLDVAGLQAGIDAAKAMVRAADLDGLVNLVPQAASLLEPFLALDLSGLPAGDLGALITRVETEIASIAADIAAIDPAEFVAPLTDGIRTLTSPLRELDQLVSGVVISIRAALAEVRDAVAALPFQTIADTLSAVLDPIAELLDAISQLLADIETALNAAADVTSGALAGIDGALDAFKGDIDAFFGEAQAAVEAVDLDQVVGQITQGVEEFSQLLAQAQMKPYFDTAVGAIDAATDVVSAVPFGLLPESMKADVDAAVKPIKETDVEAVETEIEALLGISADGTFALRGDVEAAIADIAAKYQALLDAVEERSPRVLLQEVDEKLDDIAERVNALAPDLTLQPVRDAIDQVKAVVDAIDLDTILQPIRDVFTEINSALDRYSPSQLIAPLEARIAAVRTAIIEQTRLDQWAPTLDDIQERALGFIDFASPERLTQPLQDAFQEALDILDRFPQADATRGFGTIVAGLLGVTSLRIYPASFPTVRDWLAGGSGSAALTGRAGRFAASLAATKAAVESIDLDVAAPDLAGRVAAVKLAAAGLAGRLDAGSSEAASLTVLLPKLDATLAFSGLSANRARYLAGLTEAAGLADALGRTGFSEVDLGVAKLRGALQPLSPAWQKVQEIFSAMGIDPDQLSVTGIVRALLSEAPPERLANVTMPIFDALRSRIEALLTSIVAPLKDAIADFQHLLDAIDLAPLAEAADGIVVEVKDQIGLLSPDNLLREPLQSFAVLKQALTTADPLAAVTAILDNLKTLIAQVLTKLSLETLLATPLAIYDFIIGELRKIDPRGLIDPVFEQLDQIAEQVDSGLDQTVASFKRLQDALPSGGGGSSVSVEVGIG